MPSHQAPGFAAAYARTRSPASCFDAERHPRRPWRDSGEGGCAQHRANRGPGQIVSCDEQESSLQVSCSRPTAWEAVPEGNPASDREGRVPQGVHACIGSFHRGWLSMAIFVPCIGPA